MKSGSVIRFTSVTDRPEPHLQLGYKAERTEQFVAVVLGMEPRDGSADLDVEGALNALGWFMQGAEARSDGG